MSFDNFFRNWGFSRPPNFDEEFPDDGENTDLFNEHSFYSEVDDMRKHFEKHFENVFKSFGFMDFGGSTRDFENAIPNFDRTLDVPLRDKFLKEPDSEHSRAIIPKEDPSFEKPQGLFRDWFKRSPMEDKDLDNAVSSRGIESLLKQQPSILERDQEPVTRSFFSSSSVTITSADGKTEHRFSKKDSLGNEETVVKRSFGDQSHSIAKRITDKGVEEEENFENMQDENLEEFNRKWNTNEPLYLPPTSRPDEHFGGDSSAPGYYQRLFRKFLPQPKDK